MSTDMASTNAQQPIIEVSIVAYIYACLSLIVQTAQLSEHALAIICVD